MPKRSFWLEVRAEWNNEPFCTKFVVRIDQPIAVTVIAKGSAPGSLRRLLPLLPLALAVSSVVLGWALRDVLGARETWIWSLLPTSVIVAARLLERRWTDRLVPGSSVAVAVVSAHLVLVLATSVLNPLFSVYAFTGYVDSDRLLRERQATVATVATGLVCAVGQSGGIPGALSAWWLYPGLAAVNVGIAMMMRQVSRDRERDVRAREGAVTELLTAQRQNAELQRRLVWGARAAGIDEERARLSREIHDTVAQGLIAVIRQLEAVSTEEPAVRGRIDRAEEAARDCLTEARRAVRALAPHQLEKADLITALQDIIGAWARTNRIVTEFDADEPPPASPHDAVLLRAAQEALANVARHSGAKNVRIILDANDGHARLRVTDDGCGFDPDQAVTTGHGLRGLADRVRAANGSVKCASSHGTGCTITVEVPC